MKISNETKLILKQTHKSKNSGIRQHFISDIVKENSLTLGAEIGVRNGQTLFYILEQNPALKMHAVDKKTSQFVGKIKEYKDRVFVHEVDSRQSPDYVADQSLDFFFVDASHTYKNVKKDLIAWIPKLKKNGWMIGHDINYPSVEAAVREVIGKYEVGPDNVWFYKNDEEYKGLQKL